MSREDYFFTSGFVSVFSALTISILVHSLTVTVSPQKIYVSQLLVTFIAVPDLGVINKVSGAFFISMRS
ncbi:MAG: hypothetical protein WCJ39_05320 [bacterium]